VIIADRCDAEVNVVAQPAIECHFATAVVAAAAECGVVNKLEINRFLDLVRVLSREKDIGDVSLEELNSIDGMRIGRRVQECLDHWRMVGSHDDKYRDRKGAAGAATKSPWLV